MATSIEIKGYKILRTLGQGGMATVYLAVQESFEREVALKVMSPSLSADPTFGERFLREARIVSRLVHPNIVTVYDVGVDNGYHFLSMEYVPGQDLKDQRFGLTLPARLRVIKEVAGALDFAGSQGYVHRDVKPENIMLHARDSRAVLMDFGIARPADGRSSMTQTGIAIGTPHYMSPEQAKGREVDGRSDLYSLGVVLYLLLEGHVPYDADSAVAVGIKHVSEPIPRLSPELALFQSIIDKVLAKDPEARYQTGAELIAALDAPPVAQIEALAARLSPGAQISEIDAEDAEAPTVVSAPLANADTGAAPATVARPSVAAAQVNMNTEVALESAESLAVTEEDLQERPQPRQQSSGVASWLLGLLVAVAVAGGFYWSQRIPSELRLGEPPAQAVNEMLQVASVSPPPGDVEVASIAEPAPLEMSADSFLKQPGDGLLEDPAENSAARGEVAGGGESHSELDGSVAKDVKTEGVTEEGAAAEHAVSPDAEASSATTDTQSEVTATEAESADSLPTEADEGSDSASEIPDQAAVVATQLALAQHYLAADALTQPAGANALETLRQVLALEPEHAEALAGVQAIAQRYLQLSRTPALEGQWQRALGLIDKGLTVVPDHPDLASTRQAVEETRTRQHRMQQLLEQARELRGAGQLLQPDGNSAFDRCQAALSQSVEHPVLLALQAQAQEELKAIEVQADKNLAQLLAAGELVQLEEELALARQKFPDSALLRVRQLALDSAVEAEIQAAIEASRPKVPTVVVSSSQLEDIDAPQALSLDADRTIHIGFQYENFQQATSVVQAILFDGARSLQIAQVPVVVTGKGGVKFFRIDRPVEGFAEGGYNIDLLLGGDRLSTVAFRVGK